MNAAAKRGLLVVVCVVVPLLAMRLFTPYEVQETDQGKQAQYVLDAVQNGHWLAPGEPSHAATKPPLYTWLAALTSESLGLSDLALRVPTVLAALGLVLVVFFLGKRLAGPRVGTAAAVAVATAHHFVLLSGVVRTDGLLSLLLASQVLAYVVAIDRDETTAGDVVVASALCAAACMTKGFGGLLSCGVAAVHLLATGRRRLVLRLAVVPAIAGVAAFGVWFAAACAVRDDVVASMAGDVHRHAVEGQWWNAAYYFYSMPPRSLPWLALFPSAAIVAARAVARRRETPVPVSVSLPLAWLAVHFAGITCYPHKRPDLIYPALPAAMLLVALLVDRPIPRWTRIAAPLAAVGAAALLFTPLAKEIIPEGAPAFVAPATAAFLVAAAAACSLVARRDAAAGLFAVGAALGAANMFLDTVGDATRAEKASYTAFGESARAEAATRDARIVVVGVERNAVLFALRQTSTAAAPPDLPKMPGPLLVVCPPNQRRAVENEVGPCDVVLRHDTTGAKSEFALLLLAPR
jgi:4-amino-4-deoxy-L-arabinose transferase-like glycosyltransferase